jgi:hypothetical protein
MALSRVRVGHLQPKLEQLQQERQRWAATQQERQRQERQRQERQRQEQAAGPSTGAAATGAVGGSGSEVESSDSDGSNRSRALLRDHRWQRQGWLQPLPAPDGSLPLPLVRGVPWERVAEVAAAWGQGLPPRCGLCAGCHGQQQWQGEEYEHEADAGAGESDPGAGPSSQAQRQHCATAAALQAWDRQLGGVTTAAVQRVAALAPEERQATRCGCCRQCKQQERQQQPCGTGGPLLQPSCSCLLSPLPCSCCRARRAMAV